MNRIPYYNKKYAWDYSPIGSTDCASEPDCESEATAGKCNGECIAVSCCIAWSHVLQTRSLLCHSPDTFGKKGGSALGDAEDASVI